MGITVQLTPKYGKVKEPLGTIELDRQTLVNLLVDNMYAHDLAQSIYARLVEKANMGNTEYTKEEQLTSRQELKAYLDWRAAGEA